MKRIVSYLIGVMLVLSFSGCSNNKKYSIELESNATTGFKWTYTESEKGIVEETKNEYVAPKVTEEVGTPGKQIFEFKGKKEGTVTLTFIYSRSWEEVEPAETKIYKLKVDKNKKITLEK